MLKGSPRRCIACCGSPREVVDVVVLGVLGRLALGLRLLLAQKCPQVVVPSLVLPASLPVSLLSCVQARVPVDDLPGPPCGVVAGGFRCNSP